MPASSAAVTNGVTSSSSSLTGSTGLALPSARVPESLKQHMEPVQPVQLDKPVKPEGGEKKRKKEKKKKKEKDKERSQGVWPGVRVTAEDMGGKNSYFTIIM